ncbi:MAG: OB-fold-containig protein, partial [Pseudomonadota bacterium]
SISASISMSGSTLSLIILIVFLTAFGAIGYAAQSLVSAGLGAPLPVAVASVVALFGALPTTRASGLFLARIMPKEYSEAASQREFVGRTATIIRGEARRGAPAEAKVKGPFGKTHYILLEPDADDAAFEQGASAVIIGQTGAVYRGVPDFDEYLATHSGDAVAP